MSPSSQRLHPKVFDNHPLLRTPISTPIYKSTISISTLQVLYSQSTKRNCVGALDGRSKPICGISDY